MNYTFETLGSTEFELLVRDLLNNEYRLVKKYKNGLADHKSIIQFNSFKEGKDQGIDLYYEYKRAKDESKGCVVVQVKHSKKDYKELERNLRKKNNGVSEIDKVIKLSPDKYIFATSVPLSLHNKQSIKNLFSPYILRVEDIYGRDDLNRLLETYPRIEKRYVTLYFSNHLVLERLLKSNIYVRSNYTIPTIQRSLAKYVQTESYSKALSILNEKDILIIKGMPGIGKSSLAELLLLHLASKYKNIYIIQTLRDDYESLIEDNESAVFFFDDFLGANYNEVSGSNYDNTRLHHLFRRIRMNRNKKLIVTTRTVVLNKATSVSDKIKRIVERSSHYEIALSSYSFEERKDILKKHCNYYGIKYDDKIVNANELIYHESFSPRIVDHYLGKEINGSIRLDEVYDKIIKGFDNPVEIWEHSYKNQISSIDRMFLSALFLYGAPATDVEMKDMFQGRITYEKLKNNYTENYREYKDSFKILDGAFIDYTKDRSFTDDYVIQFINPSIKDFLAEEYRTNTVELKNSILAFSNIIQLTSQFSHQNKDLLRIFSDINEFFFNRNTQKVVLDFAPWDIMNFLLIASKYYEEYQRINVFDFYLPSLHNSFIDDVLEEGDVVEFLHEYRNSPKLSEYVLTNHSYIFISIFMTLEDEDEVESFLELLKLYNVSLDSWLLEGNNEKVYNMHLERLKKSIVIDEIYDRIDQIYNWKDVEFVSNSIKEYLLSDSSVFEFTAEFLYDKLNSFDWSNKIKYNKMRDYK